jgi:hypothetical protein
MATAAPLRFNRFERVRARQRARRRRWLIVVTALSATVAVCGVLGFTVVRGTPSEQRGHSRVTAPVQPPFHPASPVPVSSVTAPASPLAAAPRREPAAPAPRRTADAEGAAPAPATASEAEAPDSTAAIDWLLQTSERKVTRRYPE